MNCTVATIGALATFVLACGLMACDAPPKAASMPVEIPAGVAVIGSEAQPAKALWLSADGRVVAGYTSPPGRDPNEIEFDGSPPHSSFRWTKAGGLMVV